MQSDINYKHTTRVSAGYRVAICTSTVMAIKEYNGSS